MATSCRGFVPTEMQPRGEGGICTPGSLARGPCSQLLLPCSQRCRSRPEPGGPAAPLAKGCPSVLRYWMRAGEEQRKCCKAAVPPSVSCHPLPEPPAPPPSPCFLPGFRKALQTWREPALPGLSLWDEAPFGINQQTQTAARCCRANRLGDKML